MRKTIISLLISFILFEPEYMFAQSFQWLTSMGGISSALNPGADEIVREVKVDEQGNVYACGRIRQYAAFSGITVATYGDYDIFLAKYNCQGNLVWVRTAGGSAGDDAFSIALNSSGQIYMTGFIDSDPVFPVTFFDTILSQESTRDMFLAKFDTSGNYLWGKFSGPGMQNTFAQGFNLELDSNSNPVVHVSTAMAGELFPGWNVGIAPYIAQFDTAGTLQQLFTFSSNYSLDASNFAIDSQNNYYVCGFWSADSVILGNQVLYNPKPGITVIGYVSKFTNTGNLIWTYMLTDTTTGPAGTRPWGIAIDNFDNVLLSGKTTAGLKCGNYVFTNVPGFSSLVPYLIKINPTGLPVWAAQGYQEFIIYGRSGLALKSNGNAVFTGAYRGTAIFNNDTLTQSFNGSSDLFLAEVDPNGQMLGAVKLGSTGNNTDSYSTVTDPLDNVYMGGTFNGVLSANTLSVSNSGGYSDGFIAKYGTICTTGIEETNSATNLMLNLFPNPVSNILNIASIDHTVNSLHIYNSLGQIVFKQQISPDNLEIIQINVSLFPPGIYIVKLTGSRHIPLGKFIKEQ
ncbi:MAG: T9SS type A sorting domain-containing protein [Chitinophagaceae bacterium]|nr:T9SS type A sorting domain-containing protein [Chitinophagaceae bacterium]